MERTASDRYFKTALNNFDRVVSRSSHFIEVTFSTAFICSVASIELFDFCIKPVCVLLNFVSGLLVVCTALKKKKVDMQQVVEFLEELA